MYKKSFTKIKKYTRFVDNIRLLFCCFDLLTFKFKKRDINKKITSIAPTYISKKIKDKNSISIKNKIITELSINKTKLTIA